MSDEGDSPEWELARLDQAVANAIGKVGVIVSHADLTRSNPTCWLYHQDGSKAIDFASGPWQPTRSWEQAGKILDGLHIIMRSEPEKQEATATIWKGHRQIIGLGQGKTLLEAAMRAFVDSKRAG